METKYLQQGSNLRPRIKSPVLNQLSYRGIAAWGRRARGGTRTHTVRLLRTAPLPIGLTGLAFTLRVAVRLQAGS